MKPLKTKVSITLDTNIIEKIKELAEADDRSFMITVSNHLFCHGVYPFRFLLFIFAIFLNFCFFSARYPCVSST